MIAVQGPLARDLVAEQLGLDRLTVMKYFSGCRGEVDGQSMVYSRTGYTGEDGAELIVPAEIAEAVWQRLLAAGNSRGVRAAGLGARDTLRLESAMPLYGHELTEQITPLQAGLGFAVDLVDRRFPGHDVLQSLDVKALPRRVGLRLAGKRVARQPAHGFESRWDVGRRGHQWHILSHPATIDCDGLRYPGVMPSREQHCRSTCAATAKRPRWCRCPSTGGHRLDGLACETNVSLIQFCCCGKDRHVKPEELLYAKTHEWVRLEDADGGQVATVGISDFALQQLTDLVYIDLPQVGQASDGGTSIWRD